MGAEINTVFSTGREIAEIWNNPNVAIKMIKNIKGMRKNDIFNDYFEMQDPSASEVLVNAKEESTIHLVMGSFDGEKKIQIFNETVEAKKTPFPTVFIDEKITAKKMSDFYNEMKLTKEQIKKKYFDKMILINQKYVFSYAMQFVKNSSCEMCYYDNDEPSFASISFDTDDNPRKEHAIFPAAFLTNPENYSIDDFWAWVRKGINTHTEDSDIEGFDMNVCVVISPEMEDRFLKLSVPNGAKRDEKRKNIYLYFNKLNFKKLQKTKKDGFIEVADRATNADDFLVIDMENKGQITPLKIVTTENCDKKVANPVVVKTIEMKEEDYIKLQKKFRPGFYIVNSSIFRIKSL